MFLAVTEMEMFKKVSAAMPTMVMYFACLALMAAEKQLSSA